MPRHLPALVTVFMLAGCTIQVPISALLPPPKSGTWELTHQGDGSTEEIVLEFERDGNLKIWDAESVRDDRAYRDPEVTLDAKMHRWSREAKKVEFLFCPPRGEFCGFYDMKLVANDRLEGFMLILPPDGEQIHRVDYVATYKNSTLPTRYRPTPTPPPPPSPSRTAEPESSPVPSVSAEPFAPASPAGGPDLVIL